MENLLGSNAQNVSGKLSSLRSRNQLVFSAATTPTKSVGYVDSCLRQVLRPILAVISVKAAGKKLSYINEHESVRIADVDREVTKHAEKCLLREPRPGYPERQLWAENNGSHGRRADIKNAPGRRLTQSKPRYLRQASPRGWQTLEEWAI